MIVYGLSRVGDGNAAGGSGLTTALVAGGVLLIGGFVLCAMRSGTSALIDVTLFLRRSVGSASLMMFLVGMVLYGSMFLLPLFWQLERGETVLAAAILLIPQGLGSLGTKLFIARWVNRFGASIVCFVSFLVIAVATVPFALAGASTDSWWLGLVLFVRGLGLGAVMVPIVTSAYVGLTPSEVAHASMQTRALQQLGGAFGVALGAVLLQALAGHGVVSEFHWVFWVFTTLAVVASVGSFTLPVAERPVRN